MGCSTHPFRAPHGDGFSSCSDAPTAPLIDVEALSRELPDGVYYAGRQLAPWMTTAEHQEHRELWWTRDRVSLARSARMRELRMRRTGQSIVMRWEIVGGIPSSPTPLRKTSSDGIDDEDAPAFSWGTGRIYEADLVHAILNDTLYGRYRSDSSNDYLESTEPLFEVLGETWLISQASICQHIATEDFHAAVERARADGLDPAELLRGMSK